MSTAFRRLLGSALFSTVAVAVAGCSGTEGETSEATGDEAVAVSDGANLTLELTLSESKQLYVARVESFLVRDGAGSLPCREQDFFLTSPQSLYAKGWSPDRAADFAESGPNAKFRMHEIASCRDARTEVLAWFGKERDDDLPVASALAQADYDARALPLLLRRVSLEDGQAKYFACDGAFQRTKAGETATETRYDVKATCRRTQTPTRGQLGPVEFISSPGPYAAYASYYPWRLPAVASTPAKFETVRAALLAKVAAGKYAGAMSTLAKGCSVAIEAVGDKLVLEHVTESSQRTRRLELEASALRGFVEGDLFADLIRAEGEKVGRFAAAEFEDGKGGSVVVRFEQQSGREGKVVRIDGRTTYCRRLAAQ
jgi:hypothetical protein